MRGFSLVEIAIVLMISAVLSAMFIGYNQVSQRQIALSTEQARVVGFLTRAKAFALEKNFSVGGGDACGFGVHFPSSDKLVIFKTTPINPNKGCIASNFSRTYGQTVEEMILDKRVKIDGNPSDIFFEPPYLVTFLNGNRIDSTVTISVSLVNNNKKALILIGAGGDISAGPIQ
jgi:prepilin-type N-terminal cleavage/methylation domain-containing protein